VLFRSHNEAANYLYEVGSKDSNSCLEIAELYQMGRDGWPKDFAQAVFWYLKAIEDATEDELQENAYVYGLLASLYAEGGPGLPKDYAQAANWYAKGSHQGDIDSTWDLGKLYETGGPGLQQDLEQAQRLTRQALDEYHQQAQDGDADGQYGLGQIYEQGGPDFSPDYVKAQHWYLQAVQQGNLAAKLALAQIYKVGGYGLSQDYGQAIHWYREFPIGSPYTQWAMGELYMQGGSGLDKDPAEGERLFVAAGESGDAHLQYSLGIFYLDNKNYSQAEKWFHTAALQNNHQAQWELGKLYQEGGVGLDKDEVKAKHWCNQGYEALVQVAQQGDITAQKVLGTIYEEGGPDLLQDYDKAVHWYQKAAEQGDEPSQKRLAALQAQGAAGMRGDDARTLRQSTSKHLSRNFD
jgi:TPR repeat protein